MFKKLIVIMAMFALVTGFAFAQANLGGQLQQGMTLLEGNNVRDTDVTSGGSYMGTFNHEAKYSVTFGDGTAGGRLVYTLNSNAFWGWLAWRPGEKFRVKIGSDGDGEWGIPQIVGWGFTGEAKNSVAAVNDWGGGLYMSNRNTGLNYGGFDGAGNHHLGFSFWPTDMVQINVLFRDIDNEMEISERLALAQLMFYTTFEGIGTLRIAAVGLGGFAKDAADGANYGNLFVAFHSSQIVQGLGFEVGLRYNPPRKGDSDTYDNINVAFGINLTSTDPINLKVRSNVGFGGKNGGNDRDATFNIALLPSYKFPKFTAFFHTGVGMEFKDELEYEFFINPYIWMPVGSMRMWIGLQILDQHRMREDDVFQFAWKIPFGFNFYF